MELTWDSLTTSDKNSCVQAVVNRRGCEIFNQVKWIEWSQQNKSATNWTIMIAITQKSQKIEWYIITITLNPYQLATALHTDCRTAVSMHALWKRWPQLVTTILPRFCSGCRMSSKQIQHNIFVQMFNENTFTKQLFVYQISEKMFTFEMWILSS